MTKNIKFNYIITIHNKEILIREVLMAVMMICKHQATIYTIIDGCTDNTEPIIDEVINTYQGISIVKIHTKDVHELLSINVGLKNAKQDGIGFNIILQDDVILQDLDFEDKIINLYKWAGTRLGVVSFRLGANFSAALLNAKSCIPQTDLIENAYGHGVGDKPLLPGRFVYRDIAIKSPICIPFYVTKKIGYLDERLAPYAHDDLEYAIRCYKANYRNGVYALKFRSDLKWGGTRTVKNTIMESIITRNMNNLYNWYGKEMLTIAGHKKDHKIYKVIKSNPAIDKKAKIAWSDTKIAQTTVVQAQLPRFIANIFSLISKS